MHSLLAARRRTFAVCRSVSKLSTRALVRAEWALASFRRRVQMNVFLPSLLNAQDVWWGMLPRSVTQELLVKLTRASMASGVVARAVERPPKLPLERVCRQRVQLSAQRCVARVRPGHRLVPSPLASRIRAKSVHGVVAQAAEQRRNLPLQLASRAKALLVLASAQTARHRRAAATLHLA